jgi:hypothetical protein
MEEISDSKINVLCEQLEEAAEYEAHNPSPSGIDPDLLLDAKAMIDALVERDQERTALVGDLLEQVKSMRTTLVDANAEIQYLIAAGGVH